MNMVCFRQGGTKHSSASETIMNRGILLVSVFYGCWSIIIIVGFGTVVGIEYSPIVDVFGAWLSKLMPIIDGVILLKMMDRVVTKKDDKASERGKSAANNSQQGSNGQGNPRSSIISSAASGNSPIHRGSQPRMSLSTSQQMSTSQRHLLNNTGSTPPNLQRSTMGSSQRLSTSTVQRPSAAQVAPLPDDTPDRHSITVGQGLTIDSTPTSTSINNNEGGSSPIHEITLPPITTGHNNEANSSRGEVVHLPPLNVSGSGRGIFCTSQVWLSLLAA